LIHSERIDPSDQTMSRLRETLGKRAAVEGGPHDP
jgi:hypothetical protein